MHFPVATIALAAALLLTGCGQMGPLYEPEASVPAPASPAPASAPATTTTP